MTDLSFLKIVFWIVATSLMETKFSFCMCGGALFFKRLHYNLNFH